MDSKRFLLAIFCILTLQTFSVKTSSAQNGELAVIVNTNNPVESMSESEIKNIYLKKRKSHWPNGEKIRPIDRLGSPMQKSFLGKVLKMSIQEFERYWIEKQYVHAESPPKRVADDSQIIKFVETFKGAIGFVDKKSFNGEAKKIKTVLVISY